LPEDYDARLKVRVWHDKLKGMSASEELNEELARQMSFDIESAHSSFARSLKDT